MRREIWAFLVLAALLVLLFRLPGGEWRKWREGFFSPVGDSASAVAASRAAGDYAKVAGAVQEYVDWLRETKTADRLERISDSLSAVLGDLEERRSRVEKAGSLSGIREGEDYDETFWQAARAIQELERAAGNALVEVDSIRTRLEHEGERKAPSISKAAEIRWNEPVRLGVREACLSCHQELDGSERVLLSPGRDNEKYPGPMLHHAPREFGCTVCHRGSPQALDFVRAHGVDYTGPPFRPGRLALRSCGLCHDRAAPVRSAGLAFEWPEDCINCHAGQSLARLAPDSLFPAKNRDPVAAERAFRMWLIRHWSVKTGRVPERELFEHVYSTLLSGNGNHGRGRTVEVAGSVADTGRGGVEKGALLACPSCGRRFKAAGGLRDYYCPVDGARLERLGKE